MIFNGSGGANDITSSSREVVVCLQQSPRRFVDKVPYITAPGRTVRTAVSDLGVYEKTTEHGELTLAGLYGDVPEGPAVQVRHRGCGAPVDVQMRCDRDHPVDAADLESVPGPAFRLKSPAH